MIPADQAARHAALDPRACVCVSAPAGSGKTAILVHRLLLLLARVEAPENVVAITFTRKAAAEMRARVLAALRRAHGDAGADSPHERELLDAAAAVVQRDRELTWGLTGNPTRLAIQTIDSFCGELTQQMPILSGLGGAISGRDDTTALYREVIEDALRNGLAGADPLRTDIEILLLHLDNRWDTALDLLAGLLARREQWQPLLGGRGLDHGARSVVQDATRDLVQHRIDELGARLAAQAVVLEDLCAWRAGHLPDARAFRMADATLADWQGIADLLLTKDDAWRRSVNKAQGFPPGKGPAAEKKAAMLELLAGLSAADDGSLARALGDLRRLPDPGREDPHWSILAAVTRLLPRISAELLLAFRERAVVDHAQVALAALGALGDDRAPTDLALRLDHRIEHLLVDEFQDTSSLQFELLRRLTRGWAEHNAANVDAPRTLMIVGDPMQSIYGFREANVGLFIRARDEGIGDLALRPLDLKVNFRSTKALVEWANAHFGRAFPQRDDPAVGAVTHARAQAARDGGEAPRLLLFSGEDSEAARAAEVRAVCDAVEADLAADATATAAILGRSRAQLRPFLAELRRRGVPLAARDMEPLATRPLIRDLRTLLTVLTDRSDRLAWLALLRTPAIALDNADLWAMAMHAPTPGAAAGATLSALENSLSTEGRERLHHVLAVLSWAEHYRDRLALRVWVEESWLRLGADGALSSAAEAEDARQFFRLLETLEQDAAGISRHALDEALDRLFASPGSDDSRLQVMTLHKAKGLEFDSVFIPALAQTTRSEQAPLLLWDEFSLPHRGTTLLLDVQEAVGASRGPRLHDYLRVQLAWKRRLEATRLFYVGCTRAARRLYLSATLPWKAKDNSHGAPPPASLLAALWPGLEGDAQVEYAAGDAASLTVELPYRRLVTLPDAPQRPRREATPGPTDAVADNRGARALGTAVHRALEALVYRRALPDACDDALRALLRVTLIESGADRPALAALLERAVSCIDRSLGDAWLRWALDHRRTGRRAEHPLSLRCGDDTRSLVVDYVFTDEDSGETWVLDYKTSQPEEGMSLDAFFAAQACQYREQLEFYRSAMAATGAPRVRCALYFPALGRHFELLEPPAAV